MQGYQEYDRISEIETSIVKLDVQITKLQDRIDREKDEIYLEVETGYDNAIREGDKEKAAPLSNEKKRKLKAKEIMDSNDELFEMSQEVLELEQEKLQLLIELGAEQRDFAKKYGPLPIRQIAKMKQWA